jgi:replicative DNA helicase
LILIGARSGVGKTKLAADIAQANAADGKRVHYFALEAEPDELERRQKFSLLARRVNKEGGWSKHGKLRYAEWMAGDYENWCKDLELKIDAEESIKPGCHTFYKDRDFTPDDVEAKFLAIQHDTDLVVLDHLHYVDSDDPNENRSQKALIKLLRDLALSMGKPVIVVAHVRKSDRKAPNLVPDLDDFHGSSDIAKIATRAIMFARADDQPHAQPWLWPTYMHIPKDRLDGSLPYFPALMNFDARVHAYSDTFQIGRFKDRGQKFELLPEGKQPDWAKDHA